MPLTAPPGCCEPRYAAISYDRMHKRQRLITDDGPEPENVTVRTAGHLTSTLVSQHDSPRRSGPYSVLAASQQVTSGAVRQAFSLCAGLGMRLNA
jgi:hypothetical protein